MGFVVNIKGKKSHDIIDDGLRILERLEHRGGSGVIAAILAKRGIPDIIATDTNPKAIACATANHERKGISYTYDTMLLLNERDPDTDYYFIIGADMVDYLPKWHRIDELVEIVQFVGVQRPRYKAGTSYPVIWVDVPLMDISSSMVRDFVAKGRTPNFMLPKPVLDYIKKEGLYQ